MKIVQFKTKSHTPPKIANIYIVYDITKKNQVSSYPTLENCLFGSFS